MKLNYLSTLSDILSGDIVGNEYLYDKIIEVNTEEIITNAGNEFEENLLRSSTDMQLKNVFRHYLYEFQTEFSLFDDFYKSFDGFFSRAHKPEIYYSKSARAGTYRKLNKEERYMFLSSEVYSRFLFEYIDWNSTKYKIEIIPIMKELNVDQFFSFQLGFVKNKKEHAELVEENPYPTVFCSPRAYNLFNYVVDALGKTATDLSFIFVRSNYYDLEIEPLISCTKTEFQKFCMEYFKLEISKLKSPYELGNQINRENKYKALVSEFNRRFPA